MSPATAAATAAIGQTRPLPPPNTDFYELYETLNAEELATVKRVRAFMEAKVAPVATKYWVDDAFPFEHLLAEECHLSFPCHGHPGEKIARRCCSASPDEIFGSDSRPHMHAETHPTG
jgi:hypothetical protein